MISLTLTSKRQATFPKEACEAMGLKPGDVIGLEARDEGGTRVWVLHPPMSRERTWVGCLESRAKETTDHSMDSIRASIAVGRAGRKGSD